MDAIQLAGVQGVGDLVSRVKTGHRGVGEFQDHADMLGVIQRGDERQGVAGRRDIEVSARLIGFGLDGQPHRVALAGDVRVELVEPIAKPLERINWGPARVDLCAVPTAPDIEQRRAQQMPHIDRRLIARDGQAPDAGLIGDHTAVLEDRFPEHGRSAGIADDPGICHAPPRLRDQAVPLDRRTVCGNEILGVEFEGARAVGGQPANRV